VARGVAVTARVEDRAAQATVEGVVPAGAGNLYIVNAVIPNADGELLAGSAAMLALPQGRRPAVVVPVAALRREGDLVGVTIRAPAGDDVRWIRVGAALGEVVEVVAGLRPGDQVVVPTAVTGDR
jgi:hypothetical protein